MTLNSDPWLSSSTCWHALLLVSRISPDSNLCSRQRCKSCSLIFPEGEVLGLDKAGLLVLLLLIFPALLSELGENLMWASQCGIPSRSWDLEGHAQAETAQSWGPRSVLSDLEAWHSFAVWSWARHQEARCLHETPNDLHSQGAGRMSLDFRILW